MVRLALPFGLSLLAACKDKGDDSAAPDPMPDADVFVALGNLGDAIPGLDAETQALYDLGDEIMRRAFTPEQGLGPTFNTDSCGSCHQFPVRGGSAPRYRDFWLVKTERFDGALEDAGSNGQSPVRNLYGTHPAGPVPEPEDTALYARRNTPPFFGVGLFEFVPDDEILSRVDADDADGDGISGRPNYEQNRVGRFGYKSQASGMESFNRGAMLNQMGLTSNPLFYRFPGSPSELGARTPPPTPLDWLFGRVAHAQVSAPGQPTTDSDGVADPELSDDEQLALLVFSTYLAAPRFADGAEDLPGAALFDEIGCGDCHVPRIASTLGMLPAYTDLLLHDMGEDRADGIGAGLARGSEFRTQPLWGTVMSAPFLHDGAADTLQEAIALHGGEGESSRDAFAALSTEEQDDVVAFLGALGGVDPGQEHFTAFQDVPAAGEPGGPKSALSSADQATWEAGRALFDRDNRTWDGLGTYFNADSCRACHQDPVLGGAGGIDTSVVRYGHLGDDGAFEALDRPVQPRSVVFGQLPARLPAEADVVELRQPPTVLGVGLVDGISESAILALEDPDDLDGDGVTGRARTLADGRLGRFGWKAQVPSVADFAADALLNEVGLTVDPAYTDFTTDDDGDALADPELALDEWEALTFYLLQLGPPAPKAPDDDDAAAAGEQLFDQVGCADCHVPEVDGVALYSDLLLHDVAPAGTPLVDQEPGVEPTEFRTPPLWGVSDTAPYLHNGSASTLSAAITDGHAGEADGARDAFEALSASDQRALLAFLATL